MKGRYNTKCGELKETKGAAWEVMLLVTKGAV